MPDDILKAGRSPLFLQVAELLRQDIDAGRFASGQLLPTFDEIGDRYGVSKITVRQAIQLLADEGLVEPRRGRGTKVLPRRAKRRALKVETRLTDLVEMYRGDVPEVVPLDDTEADLPESRVIGQAAPGGYHMLRRLHARDGQRYCDIKLYFERNTFNRFEQRFRSELALPVLTSEPSIVITEARQTMQIGKAGLEVARHLSLEIGDPVAEVRRILCDASGEIIYLADIIYRGDYVRLDVDLLA